ncbi:MAG: hypothetical protein DMD91_28820 [Candidatus Rokuibacteriota bacterium]|nr:MAG: hypothetical protein DMD91_28820 [Candidatus Rokubacteria bacterium]
MTRGSRGIVAVAVVWTIALAIPAPARGNGVTQREIQGRVVSVDASAGSFVVAREFRGKTTRVTLKAAPALRVFTCADTRAGLDRVKAGMTVSAFYEVVGSADGVANLIVIEPTR